jgi:hypothetical protein
VAVLVELGYELRSDEAGAADDHDLHVLAFRLGDQSRRLA